MVQQTPDDLAGHLKSPPAGTHKHILTAFFSPSPPNVKHPSLIHFSSTPLFRLETSPEKYAHLLKKKDREYLCPIVNYFINKLGHVVFLGGDAVKNLYIHGRKKYKTLTLLAILTGSDLDKYTGIMNSIISSNDGAFSMGLKYRVRKNRQESCFQEIALARYLIEPRLESLEKLLYPLRSSTIDLNLTTRQKFSQAFENEALSTEQPVML